jgi:WD40 repeat protein
MNLTSSPLPNLALKEGNKVISGGGDNAARLYDIQTGQAQQVAQHDAPVKVVKWLETPQGGILATGSWDKTIKVACGHCPSLSFDVCL